MPPEVENRYFAAVQHRDKSHYQTSMETTSGKKPFLTVKGYVGMGPLGMMPGDAVVIFLGSRIPHVLRPCEGGKWSFMDEAYCDGVMNGELVDKVQKETFLIMQYEEGR
jgi:hypothetical protein